MFNSGVSASRALNTIEVKLAALRLALRDVADLQAWISGVADADLEAAWNLSAADVATLKSAIADGSAMNDYYNTGQPPGTYPQPASAYAYGASQRQVIGPQ